VRLCAPAKTRTADAYNHAAYVVPAPEQLHERARHRRPRVLYVPVPRDHLRSARCVWVRHCVVRGADGACCGAGVLYYVAATYYRRTSVETKRLDSLMRSALYASYTGGEGAVEGRGLPLMRGLQSRSLDSRRSGRMASRPGSSRMQTTGSTWRTGLTTCPFILIRVKVQAADACMQDCYDPAVAWCKCLMPSLGVSVLT
jgi:hypothetical protein